MIDFYTLKALTIPEGVVKRIDVGGVTVWEKPEYTPLDYIVVPAAAWFDTGIVPSGDKWTYETEIYAGSWGSNQYFYFAVRQTKSYETMYAPIHVSSGFKMYFSNTRTASAGGSKNTWYTIKSEVEDGLQKMYINGALKVTSNLAITTTYTQPLYLFAANFHGGMYQGTAGRIKYLKAYKGEELVRHFIAAKVDGICGLFDLVERKFYTNEGSGTITGV